MPMSYGQGSEHVRTFDNITSLLESERFDDLACSFHKLSGGKV